MIDTSVLRSELDNCLLDARFERWEGSYQQGKVRDMYLLEGKRILVTTDRQSAFDHVLGTIPLKGQVLNRIAEFWFERTRDIVANHVIAVPDGNITVAEELQMIPVEIVVRRYLTGSTDTSVWTHYDRGVRNFCGIDLEDGMVKNQPFDGPIITPSTKADDHDESVSRQQILERGLVEENTWEQIEEIALALFARGTEVAAQQGLILVDTKYEMGINSEGAIAVADEIHTPDSSRYWIAESYERRHAAGEEPESLDKEFLRLWLRDKGISDDNVPELDDEIRIQVAERYIDLYERVTGSEFVVDLNGVPVRDRIEAVIAPYLS
jgi:phosphoribosylaminoimidazole-succinocarboxamide synthase